MHKEIRVYPLLQNTASVAQILDGLNVKYIRNYMKVFTRKSKPASSHGHLDNSKAQYNLHYRNIK